MFLNKKSFFAHTIAKSAYKLEFFDKYAIADNKSNAIKIQFAPNRQKGQFGAKINTQTSFLPRTPSGAMYEASLYLVCQKNI